MARFELLETAGSGIGEAPASADALFELGIIYASGRAVPVDLVSAHKWFNLAAMKGVNEARSWRAQLSREMSAGQIAEAQRQAREWLRA